MIDPQFFDELRREQDRGREQARYVEQAQVRGAIQARKRPLSRLRRGAYALASGLAMAAAAAVAWQSWHQALGLSASAPAFFVGEGAMAGSVGAFIAAPNAQELPLRFADGTRVALAAGTSARVASLDEHGAHIVLEKGRVSASVVHRPGSHWQVDVGPYQVAVVGTRFDVSWDAGSRVLELRLTQGSVLVSGGFLRDALSVRAGQTLRAFSDGGRVELLDSAQQSKAQNSPTAPSAVTPKTTPPASEPSGTVSMPSSSAPAAGPSVNAAATWQTLAGAGKYREALAAAERLGFDAECRRASGSELLTLADAARLSGSAARAEQAYSAARTKLPGGGRATYGLGLIAFDHRGDFASAAGWFETYLRDQPSGSLRAEASGRLLEALERSGQRDRARSVAERYLAQYPRGPQAALAEQLLR